MTDPEAVQAALRTVDGWRQTRGNWDEDVLEPVLTLASRVRELEAAEVEREGRVCGTCFFSTYYKSIQFCTRSSTGATHHIQGRWRRPALMGHTCGAWSPRTEGTA